MRFPNAVPAIFGGLKIASTLAVVGAIVGEFVSADKGLGYLVLVANGNLDTRLVFACVFMLTLLGLAFYFAIERPRARDPAWPRPNSGVRERPLIHRCPFPEGPDRDPRKEFPGNAALPARPLADGAGRRSGARSRRKSLRAAPLKKITFQLDWIAYGRHVPYYVALEKGYFAQAGLDVNIEQGTGAMPGFRYLAADRAQFVFQDIGSMIAARVRANLKMKAVSCVLPEGAHTAFFIKGKGIAAPKDLEGKKLGFSPAISPKIMFPAFAEANHIDQSKLNWLCRRSELVELASAQPSG